jgi:hypothetical protein
MTISSPRLDLFKHENVILERIQTKAFVKPAKDIIIANIALIALFSYAASFQTALRWPFTALSVLYAISLARRAQKKEIVITMLRVREISEVAQPLIIKAPTISSEAKYFAKRAKLHPQIFFGFNQKAKEAYLEKHAKIILHPKLAKKID